MSTTAPPRRNRALRIAGVVILVLLVTLVAGVIVGSSAVNAQVDASETDNITTTAPGQFATVNSYQLHYQTVNDPKADATGAPILLIHGFSSSSAEFATLTPSLSLSRSLILPDLLGFGHSQRVTTPVSDYTHRGQAALLAGLLDQLGVQRVDLIGTSYGGAVASQFALDYPERVRRIVFIDPQIYDQGDNASAIVNLPFRLGRALTWYLLGGGPAGQLLLQSACPDPNTPCVAPGVVKGRDDIVAIKGNTDALLAFSSTPRDVRVPADLGQIRVPALAIWGDRDPLVPPENGRRLERDVPGLKLVYIAGAGHTPHLERPDEVIPLIQNFLQ